MIKQNMKTLKRINQALPGLILGIIGYGLCVQLIGVWFVTDKLRYTTGLWIGIILAIAMGIHIAVIIEESVRRGGDNTKLMSAKSVLRYAVVVIVFFVMMKFNVGNLITAFIGILGLKVSAYAQPFMHKMYLKILHIEEESPSLNEVEEQQEEEVKL